MLSRCCYSSHDVWRPMILSWAGLELNSNVNWTWYKYCSSSTSSATELPPELEEEEIIIIAGSFVLATAGSDKCCYLRKWNFKARSRCRRAPNKSYFEHPISTQLSFFLSQVARLRLLNCSSTAQGGQKRCEVLVLTKAGTFILLAQVQWNPPLHTYASSSFFWQNRREKELANDRWWS